MFLLALSVCAGAGGAEPFQLRPRANVLASGAPLDVGTYAIPCVADWNGDDLPDLLVGGQPSWKVALYTNSGSLDQPVFGSPIYVQAGGSDIYVPASGCGSPAPWVCDYNHDGRRDLLVGDGGNGKVLFYANTNTDAQPVLAPGVTLQLGAGDLSVGSRATPYVHDWDGDGLDDLLCGDGNGYVHFFRNVGTAAAPAYSADVLLQAGGTALDLGLRSIIRVCDWDGDGRKDLLGTADTYAGWCRNIGSGPEPVLAAPVPLPEPAAAGSLVSLSTGSRMRLEVTDWNRDGAPDVLIGDSSGAVFLFEGYAFGFSAMGLQEDGSVVLQWSSAEFLRYQVQGGNAAGDLTNTWCASVASGGRLSTWTNASSDAVRRYRLVILP